MKSKSNYNIIISSLHLVVHQLIWHSSSDTTIIRGVTADHVTDTCSDESGFARDSALATA